MNATDFESRWSRACGSGIGLSSHKNDYIEGVNINNFVEERQRVHDAEVGHHILGQGGMFRPHTTQRVDYSAEGKYGEELMEGMAKVWEGRDAGAGKEKIFYHGHPSDEPIDAQASLNSLTYGEKRHGEPQVHQYLWNNSKFNNYGVPVQNQPTTMLTTAKAKWAAQIDEDPYVTRSRTTAMSAALQATDDPPKRCVAKPRTEGGQEPCAERKAKGCHVEGLRAEHHKTDLRAQIHAQMPPQVTKKIMEASMRRV